MHPFAQHQLTIATMHGKEQVIGPSISRHTGMEWILPDQLNTDTFGTFSGEQARQGSPIDAARAKCKAAHRLTRTRFTVASEGSFGPHPAAGFMAANEEFLVFHDHEHEAEIVVRDVFLETNFDGTAIESMPELLAFAERVGFPAHALILKRSKDDFSEMVKGITDQDTLVKAYQKMSTKGSVFAESDMRAHLNPTRMKNIEKLAERLGERLSAFCSACGSPGFGITGVERGLACAQCGSPTRSVKYTIHSCAYCDHQQKELRTDKKYEDPMYCDLCNP